MNAVIAGGLCCVQKGEGEVDVHFGDKFPHVRPVSGEGGPASRLLLPVRQIRGHSLQSALLPFRKPPETFRNPKP